MHSPQITSGQLQHTCIGVVFHIFCKSKKVKTTCRGKKKILHFMSGIYAPPSPNPFLQSLLLNVNVF